MADINDEHTIAGSDITLGITQEYAPIPNFPDARGDGEWLPKTDWSRDGIIANDD
jgi:hypothetical protein